LPKPVDRFNLEELMMDRNRSRLPSNRARYDTVDLNLRSVNIFVQVVESGGISPAARQMGLTQSAVSQTIASLEQSLGVQLFDRDVRPMALTPSGTILLDKARGLLLSAREAIQAARQPTATTLPKLNICLVKTIAGTIGLDLVPKIQGFATQWSVQAGLPSYHSRALLTREADIVISSDPLEDEPNLERHLILREQLVIVQPKASAEKVDDLQKLASTSKLVRLSTRTTLGRQIERHLRRTRIETTSRVEFDAPEAVMAMVANNLGWSVLTPLVSLLGRSYWPKLVFAPLPGPAAAREIYVVAREKELGDVPRRIAEAAIEALNEKFTNVLSPCCPWMKDKYHLPGITPDEPFKADVQPSASSTPRWPSRGSVPSGKLVRSS
jgi:DNA-binding transcriptional LysR family regulator